VSTPTPTRGANSIAIAAK
jgi:hypothetical protein